MRGRPAHRSHASPRAASAPTSRRRRLGLNRQHHPQSGGSNPALGGMKEESHEGLGSSLRRGCLANQLNLSSRVTPAPESTPLGGLNPVPGGTTVSNHRVAHHHCRPTAPAPPPAPPPRWQRRHRTPLRRSACTAREMSDFPATDLNSKATWFGLGFNKINQQILLSMLAI